MQFIHLIKIINYYYWDDDNDFKFISPVDEGI